MGTDGSKGAPWAVWLAVTLLVFLAARQFARQVLPLLPGRGIEVGPGVTDVILLLAASWGLLLGYRWAWVIGVAFSAMGTAISAGALLLVTREQLHAALLGFDTLAGRVVLVGSLSLATLILLLLPSSRRSVSRKPA